MRMPRDEAWQCLAIISAVAGAPAIAVNTSSSMAALIVAVRWYALMVSNRSAGDGAGWLVVVPGLFAGGVILAGLSMTLRLAMRLAPGNRPFAPDTRS